MPQKKTSSYNYDSVKAHYAKYKDSVAVDWVYSAETGHFETVYVAKGEDYNGNKEQFNEFSHNLQYWVVPSFFAIMFAMIIFAVVLYRDNGKALKEKRKDSILNMMKDGNS